MPLGGPRTWFWCNVTEFQSLPDSIPEGISPESFVTLFMDTDHCADLICGCGYRGSAIPRKQHMECPRCHRVVEACCEGVPIYD